MVDVANKGRGLVVEEPVAKGEYVVEYAGDVYHQKQRKARELEYTENEEGCFILEVQTKEGWICIDPTRRPLCPGRLMNHSPSSHATLVPFRPLKINGKWRVGFVAARDLAPGDELTWDYGCSPGGIDWLKRRTAKTSAVVRKPWNVMCYMCRVFRMHHSLRTWHICLYISGCMVDGFSAMAACRVLSLGPTANFLVICVIETYNYATLKKKRN